MVPQGQWIPIIGQRGWARRRLNYSKNEKSLRHDKCSSEGQIPSLTRCLSIENYWKFLYLLFTDYQLHVREVRSIWMEIRNCAYLLDSSNVASVSNCVSGVVSIKTGPNLSKPNPLQWYSQWICRVNTNEFTFWTILGCFSATPGSKESLQDQITWELAEPF